jgi:hypothetical protein
MRRRKPVVFYDRFGKTCVRSNCVNMNQTASMKAAAKLFGKASNTGAVMRGLLQPVIPDPKDREMQRSFQGCLQDWLLNAPYNDTSPQNDLLYVSGFQFNTESDLRARCKIGMQVNRTVTGMISLFVPSFVPVDKIVAPAYTRSVQLNIAAAGYNFQTKIISGSYSSVMNINYNDDLFPPAELQIPLATSAGNLIIVAAAVTYNAMQKGSLITITEMRWRPAGVINAFYN